MTQLDQIMSVMEQAFDPHWGESWTRSQVSDALDLPYTHALLLGPDGEPLTAPDGVAAGFVLSRNIADEEELLLIAVVPQQRGIGLGNALLEAFIAEASERGATRIFLEMRHNNPAEHLYRKWGFEPIGLRKAYYGLSDGSRLDAITFGLPI